jgi:hypothetical protein
MWKGFNLGVFDGLLVEELSVRFRGVQRKRG